MLGTCTCSNIQGNRMGKPYEKPALTYEDQLAHLSKRGMVFRNEAQALKTLSRISYYRLSAYWHPFKEPDDTFSPGTSFEAAVELYEFDRCLRLTVLDAIERVEVLVRTLVTYTLGHTYGAFAHANASTFQNASNHARWHSELSEEVKRARERFLEHYRKTYDGFPNVPIWMASEVMSLGTLSRLFKEMKPEEQTKLAKDWGVHRTVVASWLHSLTYLRKELLLQMDRNPRSREAMGVPTDWNAHPFWK